MIHEEKHLLRQLVEADWNDVFAMRLQNDSSDFLTIAFATPDAEIGLAGKSHDIAKFDEVFSLAIFDRAPGRSWWREPGGGVFGNRVPKNIKGELIRHSMDGIMCGPRWVKFYSSKLLDDRFRKGEGLLDSCAAIEIGSIEDQDPNRIVIVASDSCPCCVEFGATVEDVDRLLKGLAPLELSY